MNTNRKPSEILKLAMRRYYPHTRDINDCYYMCHAIGRLYNDGLINYTEQRITVDAVELSIRGFNTAIQYLEKYREIYVLRNTIMRDQPIEVLEALTNHFLTLIDTLEQDGR